MASSRHTMQSNYIKRPTTGIELNWIELEGAHLKLMLCYMWTVLTALYYLKTRDTSMFPVLLLQKGSYDRILSTDSKVRMNDTYSTT